MNSLTRPQRVISWVCRLVAASILLQTLFFKFTGAEESIYIFTRVGMEPWGRYGSGVAELIAAVLLLTPRSAWAGAVLSLGVMVGALLAHLTLLGVVVEDDGGLLFALACVVCVCGLATAFLHRAEIPILRRVFQPRHT